MYSFRQMSLLLQRAIHVDDKVVPTDCRYKEIVDCSNKERGCPWQGMLGKYREHRCTSEFEDIDCHYCNIKFERRNFVDHQNLKPTPKNFLEGCPNVNIPCLHCKKCHERQDIKSHMNQNPPWEDRYLGCQHTPVKCIFCKETFRQQELRGHLNLEPTRETWLRGCDYVEVKCIYCREMFKRYQLKVKAQKMDEQLNEEHIRAVVATALTAKEKWYEIGLELNIDKKVLDQFKKMHQGSVKECFYEIIHAWLSSEQRKSWKTLVKALHSQKVGLTQLAKEVERSKYCA